MGRRKKLINNTGIPQDAIERVARCLLPDLIAYFESEEGKQVYKEWEEAQKASQEKQDEEQKMDGEELYPSRPSS